MFAPQKTHSFRQVARVRPNPSFKRSTNGRRGVLKIQVTVNQMTGLDTSIAELLRRVEITCKARYHAARRMSLHGWASQWTLALLAIGQIVISLCAALELHSNFSAAYVNFGSIFFGAMVLAYSLLLGMGNYPARAVKTHECGIELGRLARKLVFLRDNRSGSQADYEESTRAYYQALEKSENHTRADYLVAHYEYYDGLAAKAPALTQVWFVERSRLLGVRCEAYFFHSLQFSHYAASVVLIYTWIWFMVRQ